MCTRVQSPFISISPLTGGRPVARPQQKGRKPTHMSAPSRTLAADILEATGINAATCYQCGKCSAGCPMASESDLRPHNVMRLVMQDRREAALADESIWLCLTCETCSARCPNACDPGLDAHLAHGVDAGGLEDVGGEGTRRSAHVGRLPALLLRTGDATGARLCSIRDSKMTLLLSAV